MFMRSEPPPPLTFKKKLKVFLAVHWRGIVCFVTPLIMIAVLTPFPPPKHRIFAYLLMVMAVFWVTECIPLAITSFLPMVVFPMTGIMSTSDVCKCYMNDTIMMFLGSLILAYSVEQSGLHRRIALAGIRAIGYSHTKLLFALCFVTMFISMWITNTAATTMMIPINFAVLRVFEEQGVLKIYEVNRLGEEYASDITVCYFCSATFSASIGGIGTLIASATNLVFKGLFATKYPTAPEYLSFPLFSAFSVPLMLVLQICVYLWMCVVYLGVLRPKSATAKRAKLTPAALDAVKKKVAADWKELGPMSFWEIMVVILFSTGIIMFFCRSPQIFKGWGDIIEDYFEITTPKFAKDSANCMLIASLMFLLPNSLKIFKNCSAKFHEDLPKTPIPSVLNWTSLNAVMPYSFIYLLGGGFSLSEAAKPEFTNFNGELGSAMKTFKNLPNEFLLFLLLLFTVFITNFASNVAVCNVLTPIGMQLASENNHNPFLYNICTGFGSSYTFFLPVGTPGNLIVQSSAKVQTKDMMFAGIGPSVASLIFTWVAMLIYAPVVWPDLRKEKLDWY